MTANALIYAPGGGSGHLMRALILAKELEREGMVVTVAAQPSATWISEDRTFGRGWISLESANRLLSKGGDTIIVDTFQNGSRGELDRTTLTRFQRRYFVSRYSRTTNWSNAHDLYDTILDPYPVGRSEWKSIPIAARQKVRSVGYVVREDRFSYLYQSGVVTVLDVGQRLGGDMKARLSEIASRAGKTFEYVTTLKAELHTAQVLAVGAGYNLFYELLACGVDFRCIPLERRHDDQGLRCDLFDKRVRSFSQFERWVCNDDLRELAA